MLHGRIIVEYYIIFSQCPEEIGARASIHKRALIYTNDSS